MSNTFQVSGQKIRDARLRAGLTQNQLAHAIKTSERNIVRWETDANDPRMEYVAAIAQATGNEVSFFLGDDDDDAEARLPPLDLHLLEQVYLAVGAAVALEKARVRT